MCFSICGDGHTERPWWPTEQRTDAAPDDKVRTDCCYRRVLASETICRIRCQEVPHGGWGNYQLEWFFEYGPKPVDWFDFASYYDATLRIECNPDGGCKVNPRKKLGMHLRGPT